MGLGDSLATAGTWLVGSKDAEIIAAAADRDLSFLGSMKKRNFEDEVWDTILAAEDAVWPAGMILSSIEQTHALRYQVEQSYNKTKSNIDKLNAELSSVGQLIADDYVLLNKYANEELAVQKVMNYIMDIPVRICGELSVVVTILDILAGRYQEQDQGEIFLQALKAMSDAILGIIRSVTKIGFPEIPILGNLGEIIDEILMVSQVIEGLPEDARKKINDAQSTVNFSDRLADVLDKTVAKLINRGAEDIDLIIQNIRWLPLTLVTGLLTGIIQALTKVFNTIGLGQFNIDDFIPDMKLIPSFDFDLSMFENFAPPKNILAALISALQMIPQFVTNFKNIFKNSIFGLLWKIFNGIPILDSCFWDPDKILSATHVHLLSCQDVYGAIRVGRDLLQDCVNLQDYKDQVEIAKKKAEKPKSSDDPKENEHRALMAKYELNAASAMYDTMTNHLYHQMRSGYNYILNNDPGRESSYYFDNGTSAAASVVDERNKEIAAAKAKRENGEGATDTALKNARSMIGERLS